MRRSSNLTISKAIRKNLRSSQGIDDSPIEVKNDTLVLFSDPISFFIQERKIDGIRVFSTFKTRKDKIIQFYEWAKNNQNKIQKMRIYRLIGVLRRFSIKAKIFRPKRS